MLLILNSFLSLVEIKLLNLEDICYIAIFGLFYGLFFILGGGKLRHSLAINSDWS